jgi:hypothetical protein
MGDEDRVKIVVDLPNHWATGGEGLWARHLGGDEYELDNIPFYAYGLNYGDVVSARTDDPSLKPQVKEIVRSSGHRTLRIIFLDHSSEDYQRPYLDEIERYGASLERAHGTLVAIDVPPTGQYQELTQYLAALEQQGALSYETCEMRVPGSFDEDPNSSDSDAAV